MASLAAPLRALDTSELSTRLSEKRRELFNLRFQVATRKLANYNLLRQVRREIARIQTVMVEARTGGA